MNASEEDPTIEMDEYRVQRDDSGFVTYHPLRELYYWFNKDRGFDDHMLIFAGRDLFKSLHFMDVVIMDVRFYGESEDELDRESWADPLRALILKRLMTNTQSWYIGFEDNFTNRLLPHAVYALPPDLAEYISKKPVSEIFILEAEEPYGHGGGTYKKIFFEVKAVEIDWFVNHLWEETIPGYPIEGYLLPSDKSEIFKKWAAVRKDEALFREVLDATRCMFTTFPEERRHFRFITNKMDADEFARTIQFEELVRLARQLPV